MSFGTFYLILASLALLASCMRVQLTASIAQFKGVERKKKIEEPSHVQWGKPEFGCSTEQMSMQRAGESAVLTQVAPNGLQVEFKKISLEISAKDIDWDDIDMNEISNASDMYETNAAWKEADRLVFSQGPDLCRLDVSLGGLESWDTMYVFEQSSQEGRHLLAFVGGVMHGDVFKIDAVCAKPGHGRALLEHVRCHMESGQLELEALGYVVPFYHKLGFKLSQTCGDDPEQLQTIAVAADSIIVKSVVDLDQLFIARSSEHPLVQLMHEIVLKEAHLCGDPVLHSHVIEECDKAGIPRESCLAYSCAHEGVHMRLCF